MGAPDLLVLISLRGDGMASVAYSKKVSKSDATSDLQRLVKETGWQIQGVNITTDTGMISGDSRPTTAIDFSRSSMSDDLMLPIEPIIAAYKNLSNIQIVYLLPQYAGVNGSPNFENNDVSIQMSGNAGSCQYQVLIKNHSFEKLVLPRYAPLKQPATSKKQSSRGLDILLVVTLALTTAVCVYSVVKILTGTRGSHSKRRS
jgi:hypothetical protein